MFPLPASSHHPASLGRASSNNAIEAIDAGVDRHGEVERDAAVGEFEDQTLANAIEFDIVCRAVAAALSDGDVAALDAEALQGVGGGFRGHREPVNAAHDVFEVAGGLEGAVGSEGVGDSLLGV